jgi:hypothetical protein
VPVALFQGDELFEQPYSFSTIGIQKKSRHGGTRWPARETRALPRPS